MSNTINGMEAADVANQNANIKTSRVNLFNVLLVILFISTYVFSIVVAPFHVEGDQVHYRRAYVEVAGLSLLEALDVYQTIIYTAEPLHFIIIWVFSSIGVEKNVLMAMANSTLAVLFAKFLRQKGANLTFIFAITISCYYLCAMFFTLERTKFAFIFMLLYLRSRRNWWILLAVVTHSLTLVPLILNLAGKKIFGPKNKRHGNSLGSYIRQNSKVFFVMVLIVLLVNVLGAHIYDRLVFYSNENLSNDSFEGWSLLMLFAFTFATTREKRVSVLFFLGLLLLAIFMGSARINMIGYFGFLYFSNFRHQIFKFGVSIIGLYLLYKIWGYLANIYFFGG